MKLEDFTHNLNAKDYVIGYASPDGYKIISSDEDVETFYKLITNLIIQQSYKQLKNDSYIEPEVIVNMIHNNIASHNDFPKSAYDYEGLNKIEINNDQLSATAESLIGYRVRDEVNKLENKFNELTYSGKNGNYMVFLMPMTKSLN